MSIIEVLFAVYKFLGKHLWMNIRLCIKKMTESLKTLCHLYCRGTPTRTEDPLLPKQMR